MEPVNWSDLDFWKSETWKTIQVKLYHEQICPTIDKVFRAFTLTPLQKVKAVIIGTDPYPHGAATGLAFSIPREKYPVSSFPPTLTNIFRELVEDIGCPFPKYGDLTSWADQGVLLLNTHLTTKPAFPLSHTGWGWSELTDEVLKVVQFNKPKTPFVLWGKQAQQAIPLLGIDSNLICSSHPSPQTAREGFQGSKPFSRINNFLRKNGNIAINWRLEV